MIFGADFSPDRTYRYKLWREWNEKGPTFMVIGLNPSTADESVDDPTIRRCIAFAIDNRCGRVLVMNLFAYRTPDPRNLILAYRMSTDIIGPDNDRKILQEAHHVQRQRGKIVVAWGTGGELLERGEKVLELLADPLYCLGRTKQGFPKHPLYLGSGTRLTRFKR